MQNSILAGALTIVILCLLERLALVQDAIMKRYGSLPSTSGFNTAQEDLYPYYPQTCDEYFHYFPHNSEGNIWVHGETHLRPCVRGVTSTTTTAPPTTTPVPATTTGASSNSLSSSSLGNPPEAGRVTALIDIGSDRIIAGYGDANNIVLWDLSSNSVTSSTLLDSSGNKPDGPVALAKLDNDFFVSGADSPSVNRLKLWDISTMQERTVVYQNADSNTADIKSILFIQRIFNSRYVMTCNASGKVNFWQINSFNSNPLMKFRGVHSAGSSALVAATLFAFDVVVASEDGKLYRFKKSGSNWNNQILDSTYTASDRKLFGVAFLRDNTIVTSDENNMVKVWSMGDTAITQMAEYNLGFNAESNIIIKGTDKFVLARNMVCEFTYGTDLVLSLASRSGDIGEQKAIVAYDGSISGSTAKYLSGGVDGRINVF